jgi:hypothetical protein
MTDIIRPLIDQFRSAAIAKERGVATGDTARDAHLYAEMGAAVSSLRKLGPGGVAALRALLDDPDPEVAAWMAAEFAVEGDPAAVTTLERLAMGTGLSALAAQVTLEQYRQGVLRSPFGASAA